MSRFSSSIFCLVLAGLVLLVPVQAQSQSRINLILISDFPAYDISISPSGTIAAIYLGNQGRAFANIPLYEYEVIPELTHILLIDLDTGRTLRRIEGVGDYWGDVEFSPDGSRLAGHALNGDLYIWETDTGTQLQRTASFPNTRWISFSSPKELLVYLDVTPPSFVVWDIDAGVISRVLRMRLQSLGELTFDGLAGYDYKYTAIDVFPDGSLVATVTASGAVELHSTSDFTSRIVRPMSEEDRGMLRVNWLQFSQDGRHLIYYDRLDEAIVFYNIAEDRQDFEISIKGETFAFFSPRDQLVYTDRVEGLFALNVNSAQRIDNPHLVAQKIMPLSPTDLWPPRLIRDTLHFLPDGRLVVTGFFDSSGQRGNYVSALFVLACF